MSLRPPPQPLVCRLAAHTATHCCPPRAAPPRRWQSNATISLFVCSVSSLSPTCAVAINWPVSSAVRTLPSIGPRRPSPPRKRRHPSFPPHAPRPQQRAPPPSRATSLRGLLGRVYSVVRQWGCFVLRPREAAARASARGRRCLGRGSGLGRGFGSCAHGLRRRISMARRGREGRRRRRLFAGGRGAGEGARQ